MKIRYLAHSSFLVTTAGGARVLFDPCESGGYGGAIKYRPVTEVSDVVVISHEHADHACLAGLAGNPEPIEGLALAKSGPRAVKGVTLRAVHTYHDTSGGQERGENAVTILEADGLRLCHCGDLGHTLTPEKAREIGPVDVLLIPVGGHFTIGPDEAAQVVGSLDPAITIPMHYKTAGVDFPIGPVEDFLAGKANVRRIGGSDLEVTKDSLPLEPEIVVLEPALL
ncbi:MAG: MBL fold metallo-hydrolase [Armatimonadetes bacterium]|nr:MBL fold metallo-hydrolase [Armatimonadota bacterium]